MKDQVLSSLHYKGDLNGFHSLQLGPVLAFASLCGLTQWMGTPSASQIWKQFKMIRGKYNWKIHLFWWFSFWNPCIWETFKETVEDLHYEKLHGVPISCGHSLPRWCKPKLQFMFQCLGGKRLYRWSICLLFITGGTHCCHLQPITTSQACCLTYVQRKWVCLTTSLMQGGQDVGR